MLKTESMDSALVPSYLPTLPSWWRVLSSRGVISVHGWPGETAGLLGNKWGAVKCWCHFTYSVQMCQCVYSRHMCCRVFWYASTLISTYSAAISRETQTQKHAHILPILPTLSPFPSGPRLYHPARSLVWWPTTWKPGLNLPVLCVGLLLRRHHTIQHAHFAVYGNHDPLTRWKNCRISSDMHSKVSWSWQLWSLIIAHTVQCMYPTEWCVNNRVHDGSVFPRRH